METDGDWTTHEILVRIKAAFADDALQFFDSAGICDEDVEFERQIWEAAKWLKEDCK